MGFFKQLLKTGSFKRKKKTKTKQEHRSSLTKKVLSSPAVDRAEVLKQKKDNTSHDEVPTNHERSEPSSDRPTASSASKAESEWGNEIDIDALPPSDRSDPVQPEKPRDENIPDDLDIGVVDADDMDVSFITLENCPSVHSQFIHAREEEEEDEVYHLEGMTYHAAAGTAAHYPQTDVDDISVSVSIQHHHHVVAYQYTNEMDVDDISVSVSIHANTSLHDGNSEVEVVAHDDHSLHLQQGGGEAFEVVSLVGGGGKSPERHRRAQSPAAMMPSPDHQSSSERMPRCVSPASFHSNGGGGVQQRKPKQRNLLLKYQKSARVAEMKKTIKGYFRYIPRGTEENDISIIST